MRRCRLTVPATRRPVGTTPEESGRTHVDHVTREDGVPLPACHVDLLYSYRKGNRGRLVTVAALP